jgi:hypothetical protein
MHASRVSRSAATGLSGGLSKLTSSDFMEKTDLRRVACGPPTPLRPEW